MTTCCEIKAPASQSAVDVDDLAVMCKALGHPARVQLLKHLAEYGACYFGNLTDFLPLAPSTVSQHVTILKQSGLILGSSDEQRVCYCVNPDRLAQLKQMIGTF
ncbi:metalloregulator ArsR/SmtB family transcription factor [Massilia sp. METH4]|uniref:ArsR/SmtB family transcription factor n=1 Tax=Massilia sp. METH4 TaxID=3123041 RepID=UPI0030D4E2BE